MKISLIFIISLFLIATACKSSKKVTMPDSKTQGIKSWILKYERGPCFGQCPVYAFYLLPDHSGLINVKATLLEPGWYSAPLDQNAVSQLLSLLESDAWWHEDLRKQPEIADLPQLSLMYHHPKGDRMLTVQKQFSTSLSRVFEKLNHIVTEGRWVKTDLRPFEPEEIKTDVIVQLKPGVEINEWMKKYDRFGIQLKKKISPHQQYYLVQKDPAKGDANDFIQYIKLDEEVIGAQWDKKIEKRDH